MSSIDLAQEYWQVTLTKESAAITAFTMLGRGFFEFVVMPFELHSTPATFQRLIDKVLGPELEPNVFVYLGDMIVVSETEEQHKILIKVMNRLQQAKLMN